MAEKQSDSGESDEYHASDAISPPSSTELFDEDEPTTSGEQTDMVSKIHDLEGDLSELGLDEQVKKKGHPWEDAKPKKQKPLAETVIDSSKYPVKPKYKCKDGVLMRKIVEDLPRFTAEHAHLTQETTDYVENTYYIIDCDDISTIHIPNDMGGCFKRHKKCKTVSGVSTHFKEYRWIFVPSYCRATSGYFDWSHHVEGNPANTLKVIVVRPSQFCEYRRNLSRQSVAVLSLPQDVNGIGYARYWIQRIAERLKLDWVWMIDDSVMWVREMFRGKDTIKDDDRSFEFVFRAIEETARVNDLAAVSPRVFNGQTWKKVRDPFTYKPPRGMVLLNLKKIKEQGVRYRPKLLFLEDMVFGYECEKAGLQVCVMNRFAFMDSSLSGGMSSSLVPL